MPYGDTLADLFIWKHTVTGDHLLATEREIGEPLATWQVFSGVKRTIVGLPIDPLGPTWGRHEGLRLAYVYVLGDKSRMIIRDNIHDRPVTVAILPGLARAAAMLAAYNSGLAALGV